MVLSFWISGLADKRGLWMEIRRRLGMTSELKKIARTFARAIGFLLMRPFDCAQGDLLWNFSRSNVPSPDGSGNPLARVAILGRTERATKRSSFAT